MLPLIVLPLKTLAKGAVKIATATAEICVILGNSGCKSERKWGCSDQVLFSKSHLVVSVVFVVARSTAFIVFEKGLFSKKWFSSFSWFSRFPVSPLILRDRHGGNPCLFFGPLACFAQKPGLEGQGAEHIKILKNKRKVHSFSGWPRNRTRTVGTLFPGTDRRTGTAGTIFQKPKPELEPSLSITSDKSTEVPRNPFPRKTVGTENQNCCNRKDQGRIQQTRVYPYPLGAGSARPPQLHTHPPKKKGRQPRAS